MKIKNKVIIIIMSVNILFLSFILVVFIDRPRNEVVIENLFLLIRNTKVDIDANIKSFNELLDRQNKHEYKVFPDGFNNKSYFDKEYEYSSQIHKYSKHLIDKERFFALLLISTFSILLFEVLLFLALRIRLKYFYKKTKAR